VTGGQLQAASIGKSAAKRVANGHATTTPVGASLLAKAVCQST